MRTTSRRAFSLLEVTMTLGLISFCLVALIGLMPIGIDSVRDANRQAEAVRLLKHLATGIQGAARDGAGQYRLLGFGALNHIAWSANGASLAPVDGFLDASGTVAKEADADFSYRLELTAPDEENPASCGHAWISVAWPAGAAWSGSRWMKAQGREEILVMFRAR